MAYWKTPGVPSFADVVAQNRSGMDLFKDALTGAQGIPTDIEEGRKERRDNATFELLKMKADGKNVTQADIDRVAGDYNGGGINQKAMFEGSEDLRRYQEKQAMEREKMGALAGYRAESLKNQRLNALTKFLGSGSKGKKGKGSKFIEPGAFSDKLVSNYYDMGKDVALDAAAQVNYLVSEGMDRDTAVATVENNIESDKGLFAQLNPFDSEYNLVEDDASMLLKGARAAQAGKYK